MTKLTFLRKYSKKTGIGLTVLGSSVFVTGMGLFLAGGLATPTLIKGTTNTNAEYVQNSALNFDKESTFRGLNNQFIINGAKSFNVYYVNGNIEVKQGISIPNSKIISIDNIDSYTTWVTANSFWFEDYFTTKMDAINALATSDAKDELVKVYNFEYALTLGSLQNFNIFIAGAVLFPLGLISTIGAAFLLYKSKNY